MSDHGWPDKPCTCHPDDNPPVPCVRGYALGFCRDLAVREVAAREAAAFQRGAEAMREKAAKTADRHAKEHAEAGMVVGMTVEARARARSGQSAAAAVSAAIRALPAPEDRNEQG